MKLRNQNGTALVVVLLIITVIFVLGLSLISSALSNSKQVNKTEQEMQAVDLAEMGVIHYKNLFMETVYSFLKTPILTVVINPELKSMNDKLNAVDELLDEKDLENVLMTTPNLSINEHSDYNVTIEHADILSTVNNKISVKISSIGQVDTDTKEHIEATIEIDLQQLIEALSKNDTGNEERDQIFPNLTDWSSCTDISGCTYDASGNVDFTKFSGGFHDSNIDIRGNADFEKISGGIKNSNIYIKGNANFLDMIAGGVKSQSYIYIGGSATFEKISSGVDDTSKICVRGSIDYDTEKKETDLDRIYSFTDDSKSYNQAGCPQIDNNNDAPLSFEPQLISNYTKMNDLEYQ